MDHNRDAVNFKGNHAIALKLQAPFFSRTYGFIQLLNGDDGEFSIKYEVEIKYIKTIEQSLRVFRLRRITEIFINDTVPDLLADQLAYECGKVFYPLEVKIDFNGRYCGIYNTKEIQDRWIIAREQISDYFRGEEVKKYLQLMDKVISNPEDMATSFTSDLFISTYFNAIYKAYTVDLEITEESFFPIAARGKLLRFKTLQRIAPFLNEYNEIEIVHQGVVNDDRTIQDIDLGYPFTGGNFKHPDADFHAGDYEATYKLAANTKSIDALTAKWNMERPVKKSIEIRLFRIDHEHEADNLMRNENTGTNLVFIDGNHSEPERQKNPLTRLLNTLFNSDKK